jgi:hypothetical protein
MTAILERRESESLWGRFCNSDFNPSLSLFFFSRYRIRTKFWEIRGFPGLLDSIIVEIRYGCLLFVLIVVKVLIFFLEKI